MENKIVGYSRVMSEIQPHNQQVELLKKEGCIEILQDAYKGKDVSPLLKEMSLKQGDTLKIVRIDQISRQRLEAYKAIQEFVEKGIRIVSILDFLDTENPYWRGLFMVNLKDFND